MTEPEVPRYVVRWPDRCGWCGDQLYPGDAGSFSLNGRSVVHLECRLLEAP